MGKIYPQNEDNEVLDLARNPILDSETNDYDVPLALSNVQNPSSLGMTFTLKYMVTMFKIEITYAWYEMISAERAKENGIDISKWYAEKPSGLPKEFWRRHPEHFVLDITLNDEKRYTVIELNHGMQLSVYINRKFKTGERLITVTLLNSNPASKDSECIAQMSAFQLEIMVYPMRREERIFTSVRKQIDISTDTELEELELLYNSKHYYAQGHGCSVVWDYENDDPGWIKTSFFPSYNLKQMKAVGFDDLSVFKMKVLYEDKGEVIIKQLRSFMDRYEEWISEIERLSESLTGSNKKAATINIAKCNQALKQIRDTIDFLEKGYRTNDNIWKAFRLANEAMFLQRKQTLIKNKVIFTEELIEWHPFQLAFILHEMISFIKPEGEERKKTDLLWFPTGGGKTEAYLGIAAFTIFPAILR
jgi:hypothetical protein